MRSRPAIAALAAVLVAFPVLVLPPSASGAAPTSLSVTTGTSAGSIGDLNTVDGVGVTLTEAITGALDLTTWLTPVSDGTIQWAQVSPGTGTGPICSPAAAHYCRLDESPTTNDGNTSIVASGTAAAVSDFPEVTDWTGPTDIAIDGVSVFTWVRRNQSADPTFSFSLQRLGVSCGATAPITTQAFSNASTALITDPCGQVGWTVSEVNLMSLKMTKATVTNIATVTAFGAVVQYDDADYVVLATATWTSVIITGTVTLEVAGRLTDTGDNFDVQVQECGSGTWTTLDDSQFTASTSQRSYQVTGRVCSGTLTARIVDDDGAGEDQAALLLDQLSLTFGTGGGTGGIGEDAFVLGCTPGLQIHCTLTWTVVPLNVSFLGTVWWSGNVWQGPGSGSGTLQTKDVAAPFPGGRTNVTLVVALSNGQSFTLSTVVNVDNTWIVLAGILVLVAAVSVVLLRFARRASRSASAARRREAGEDERRKKSELYRGIIK